MEWDGGEKTDAKRDHIMMMGGDGMRWGRPHSGGRVRWDGGEKTDTKRNHILMITWGGMVWGGVNYIQVMSWCYSGWEVWDGMKLRTPSGTHYDNGKGWHRVVRWDETRWN